MKARIQKKKMKKDLDDRNWAIQKSFREQGDSILTMFKLV